MTSELYDYRYKRIKYLIDLIDSKSPTTKLYDSPSCNHSLQKHKYYIEQDNPLHILIAEGLYLLKLNKEYQQEYIDTMTR